jgi:hypothetical protein
MPIPHKIAPIIFLKIYSLFPCPKIQPNSSAVAELDRSFESSLRYCPCTRLAPLQTPSPTTQNRVDVHLARELARIEPSDRVHARSSVGGESQQVHAISVDQSSHDARMS